MKLLIDVTATTQAETTITKQYKVEEVVRQDNIDKLIQEKAVDEVTVDEHDHTKYNEDVTVLF